MNLYSDGLPRLGVKVHARLGPGAYRIECLSQCDGGSGWEDPRQNAADAPARTSCDAGRNKHTLAVTATAPNRIQITAISFFLHHAVQGSRHCHDAVPVSNWTRDVSLNQLNGR